MSSMQELGKNDDEEGHWAGSAAGVSLVASLRIFADQKLYNGAKRQRIEIMLPYLIVEYQERIFIAEDVFEWSRSRAPHDRYHILKSKVACIGRLFEFWAYFELTFTDPSDADTLVFSYLHYRLTTPRHIKDRLFPLWQPVNYQTVANEFRTIKAFSNFCLKNQFPEALLSRAFHPQNSIFSIRMPPMKKSIFLSHLESYRERLNAITGLEAEFPAELRSLAQDAPSVRGNAARTFTEEEVDAIIKFERNPIFKALWILLAFTGLRLCEALNLWLCDVLPPSYSKSIAGFNIAEAPFIVVADPDESTYTGSVSAVPWASNRRDYLIHIYRTLPRTAKSSEFGNVGFKGIKEFDAVRHLSWAFWSSPLRAGEFSQLIPIITQLHTECETDQRHPFFFVNAVNHNRKGLPLQQKNVEQAFERACVRAGVEQSHLAEGVHSLRHFFKWRCEKRLGLSKSTIQSLLRQKDVRSQEKYGVSLSSIYSDLAEANRKVHSDAA